MIIQNNFNKKSTEPLKDYHEIGKGRDSLDNKFEKVQEGYVQKNLDNGVIQDIMSQDQEFDDDVKEDKWDFFR